MLGLRLKNKKKGLIKNLKLLLVLQVLTLAAAVVGASSYCYNRKNAQKGVVKGILFTGIDSTVMVDNQVLSEGEMIYGTKVVKIYPKKVEFEKDGLFWSQRICEHPNPAWNEREEERKCKPSK